MYRYGGDSLQGRYPYLRLLPLTYAEIDKDFPKTLELLFAFSGFPEPFLRQSEKETKRWSREYQARVVRDDVKSLEQIQDLATCELLLGRLPECIGSPLSLNNLREDLGVAFKTVKKWTEIYERPAMGTVNIREAL